MVLSFGDFDDELEDSLAGSDSLGLVSHGPQSTIPVAMVGPTTTFSSGGIVPSLSSQSTVESGSGWSGFFKTLGLALVGTTANVAAQSLAGSQTPADRARLQAQAALAASKQREQLFVVGGIVFGVVILAGVLLRRRAA